MAPFVQACFVLLLAAQISYAAVPPAVFSKTLIVEDLAKCPVKSVPFDKKDFNADEVANLATVLETPDVTEKCRNAAVEQLINCYIDSDTMSSLHIMTGCCSKGCATALEESVKSGCFAQYTKAICKDPASASMQLGLSHTAKRCANYEAVCPAATANATKAANTTMAAKSANATAVTSRSTDPTATTEPAASPMPDALPAPNRNSAVSAASATCASFVLAAGALVLAMH